MSEGRELPLPPRGPMLRWTCLRCGEVWEVQMPGFPGSAISGAHLHYIGGNVDNACGPLSAVMVGRRER